MHAKRKKSTAEAKTHIRVVKKAEMDLMEKSTFIHRQSKNQGTRRMAATVMNWVSDFEARKLREKKLAIESTRYM